MCGGNVDGWSSHNYTCPECKRTKLKPRLGCIAVAGGQMIRRALANVYLHPLHIHIMHMKMSTNVDINICKYAQRCKVGCTVFGYAHRTHAPSLSVQNLALRCSNVQLKKAELTQLIHRPPLPASLPLSAAAPCCNPCVQ